MAEELVRGPGIQAFLQGVGGAVGRTRLPALRDSPPLSGSPLPHGKDGTAARSRAGLASAVALGLRPWAPGSRLRVELGALQAQFPTQKWSTSLRITRATFLLSKQIGLQCDF